MKLGILEKISSSHNNLRSPSMEGIFLDLPSEGESFSIYGEGIHFGNRIIHTTEVKEITKLDKNEDDHECVVFKTSNSTYKLTLLGVVEDDRDYLEEYYHIPKVISGVQ